MRRTRTLMTLTAVGVLFAAAACGQDDGQVTAGREEASPAAQNAAATRQAEGSTTTTSAPAATTSTTAGTGGSTTTTAPAATNGGGSAGGACGGGAPAAASSLRMRPADAPPECLEPRPEQPVAEPELGTGDVQVTLRWESAADIDLHVTEPDGTEIWYKNRGPSSTGGQLDVDSNVGCQREASVENVYWPPEMGPTGHYTVQVVGFQVDGCGSGTYTVTAKVHGQEVLRESGTVGEDEADSYSFDV